MYARQLKDKDSGSLAVVDAEFRDHSLCSSEHRHLTAQITSGDFGPGTKFAEPTIPVIHGQDVKPGLERWIHDSKITICSGPRQVKRPCVTTLYRLSCHGVVKPGLYRSGGSIEFENGEF
jgi:hypothetical protein